MSSQEAIEYGAVPLTVIASLIFFFLRRFNSRCQIKTRIGEIAVKIGESFKRSNADMSPPTSIARPVETSSTPVTNESEPGEGELDMDVSPEELFRAIIGEAINRLPMSGDVSDTRRSNSDDDDEAHLYV